MRTRGRGDFFQVEPVHLDRLDASQQGLARLARQAGGGATEQQVPAGCVGAVHQHAQQGEQSGLPLHLVDHHQAVQAFQHLHWLGQALRVRRVLQVEVVRGVAPQEALRKRAFSGLARPRQDHAARAAQRAPDGVFERGTGQHGEGWYHHEIRKLCFRISWFA